MSRRSDHRGGPAAGEADETRATTGRDAFSPEAEFARRLRALLAEREWNNSDLAREAWGERTNAAGYKEARGRDRISVFLKGETRPTAKTLRQLADAFGVEPGELFPGTPGSPQVGGSHSLSLTVVHGSEGLGRLRVDMILPLSLATQIVQAGDPRNLSLTVVHGSERLCRLQVEMILPLSQAAQLVQMVADAERAKRSPVGARPRSGNAE